MTYEKGQGLANDLNCPFLEASAKTRYNVDECFTTLVREIQKFNNPANTDVAGHTPSGAAAADGGRSAPSRRKGCQLF